MIVLPGGPEFIVNNGSNLLDHLRILVKAHQIKEIILISHSDCGYYNICLANASKGEVLRKQLDDVQKSNPYTKKNIY